MKKLLLIFFLCNCIISNAQSLRITYDFTNHEGVLKIKNNYAVFKTNSLSKLVFYNDLSLKKHYLEFSGLPFKNMDKSQLIDYSTPYVWIITNQTKNILGYKCKKATTKIKRTNISYTITAWFAEQLKFEIGPNGTFGLPGIILEIQSDKTELNCIASSIEKNQVNEIIKIPNYPIISLSTFNEILKKNTGINY